MNGLLSSSSNHWTGRSDPRLGRFLRPGTSWGLLLIWLVLILSAGCFNFESETPPSTQAATPIVTRTFTLTPLPGRPVCAEATTPQPTATIAPFADPGSPTPTLPARWPIPAGRSQLLEAGMHSEIIGRDLPIAIYLPPGYFDSQRTYPVLYMLSGFEGDYHEWINWGLCDATERLVRGGQIQPMIVVFPQGDKSWWFNHAPPPDGDGMRWGDYVWKDVVAYVDKNYRTIQDPASRAIGGLSAGGQSALMLAMTHPDVFGIVGAHSPSFRGADGSVPEFGSWDYFNQYDPFWLLDHTDGAQRLKLWIDVAGGDYQWRNCNPPPSPQRCIEVFHSLLDAKGIQHAWHDQWPGIHDNYYWSAHLVDYLAWYSSVLKGPQTP